VLPAAQGLSPRRLQARIEILTGFEVVLMFDWPPPNGLGLSGGAPLDQESCQTDSWSQNGRDLVGAERRPLQARVGRRGILQTGSR